MRVEAKKTFKEGFVLSEQEFRRLVNILRQQMEKVSGGQCLDTYEVKFRNGAIAESLSLDQVLSQENFGSNAIVRVKIKLQDNQEKPNYVITTEFIKINEEGEDGTISMRYTVVGDDRDWVFVTSSELEERLGRIKRFNITISRLLGTELFFPLLLFMMFPVMIFFIVGFSKTDYSYIDKVENAWKSGQISDPIAAMIALERGSKESIGITNKALLKPIALVAIVGLIIMLLVWGTTYFFPTFNFCWGDYVKFYERRQAQGKFIYITVILLAIIIPIAVSLISSYVGRTIGF